MRLRAISSRIPFASTSSSLPSPAQRFFPSSANLIATPYGCSIRFFSYGARYGPEKQQQHLRVSALHSAFRISCRSTSSVSLVDRLSAVARAHRPSETTAAASSPPTASDSPSTSFVPIREPKGRRTGGRTNAAAVSEAPASASSSESTPMSKRQRTPSPADELRDGYGDDINSNFMQSEFGEEEGGDNDNAAFATTRLTSHELHQLVSARLSIPLASTAYVLDQAKHGATVPFLARYRQDNTGGLDERELRAVMTTAAEVTEVHRRRQFMLKSLAQRDLLTKDRLQALQKMVHVSQLEDFWESFRVKKTSLACRARAAGLGPLADAMLTAPDPLPPTARQTIARVEDGERLFIALLAEEMQRCELARLEIRSYVYRTGSLTARVVKTARKRAAREMRETDFEFLKEKFAYYDDRCMRVKSTTGHTVLALQRGEAKGVLKVDFTAGNEGPHIFCKRIKEAFAGVAVRLQSAEDGHGHLDRENPISHGHGHSSQRGCNRSHGAYTRYERQLLQHAMHAAYDHTFNAATTTIRRDLKKSAEREAIAVFAHNLRHLLLQRPLAHARVLAMDPGHSHGVKCVALDEAGDVIAFFKCALMDEHRMMDLVTRIVEDKRLNKVVIGNGTASQQTAHLVAKVIKREKWRDVEFAVVSEAGASVYSVSEIANEEFPSLDIMFRGAVSIGRRVLDPLSELVKIPVRSMGIGMYQHDVNEKELVRELAQVVESCVALVGVNSASANRYVMEKVPGIQKKLVDQIVLARHAKRLNSREDLRRVPGMTETVFKQVAGFFRFPNSAEPLDNTNIHPESYLLVRRLMALYDKGELGWCAGGVPATVAVSGANGTTAAAAPTTAAGGEGVRRRQVGVALSSLSEEPLRAVARTLDCGVNTLKLVAQELLTPALDPRAHLPHAGLLRKEIKELKDLKPGDTLSGIVQSVTTFGAFVDCGLHDSVLVRGKDAVDSLQVGALVEGIVFHSLDNVGRAKVSYTPLNLCGGPGERRGFTPGLWLEADDTLMMGISSMDASGDGSRGQGDSVVAAVPAGGLRANLAKGKAAHASAAAVSKLTTATANAAVVVSGTQPAKRAREAEKAAEEEQVISDDSNASRASAFAPQKMARREKKIIVEAAMMAGAPTRTRVRSSTATATTTTAATASAAPSTASTTTLKGGVQAWIGRTMDVDNEEATKSPAESNQPPVSSPPQAPHFPSMPPRAIWVTPVSEIPGLIMTPEGEASTETVRKAHDQGKVSDHPSMKEVAGAFDEEIVL